MLRAVGSGILLSCLLAAPAGAAGLSGDAAAAATTAFRAEYGSAAIVTFGENSRGATFLGPFRTAPLASDPTEAAWRFLEREAGILGLTDPRATLRVERVFVWGGWHNVHFGQIAYGRPVLGRGFVVVVDDAGRVYQVAGSFADVSGVAPGDVLSPSAAAAALVRLVPGTKVEVLEPAVFAEDGDVRLAYRAEVTNGGPLTRFEVIQDAVTGEPLSAHSMVWNAQANVYDVNPILTPLSEVTLQGLTSTTHLDGDHAASWACADSNCNTQTRRAAPDGSGNYLYTPADPSLTDPFPEVEGYYLADKFNRYIADHWGFNWSCGGSNVIHVAVNLPVSNAWYGDFDGDGCGDATVGVGSAVNFANDSDVVYHELGHGIFDQVASVRGWGTWDALGPDFSGEALNEGSADYTAVTVNDDPDLGEYMASDPTAVTGETGLREADNSNTCPHNLWGESHHDGQIWLGTLWDIRVALGATKADALFLATIGGLPSTANFSDAGNGLISTSTRLVGTGVLDAGDDTTVATLANARGLPGCVRVVDLYDPDTGESLAGTAYSMGVGGWMSEMASGIQFRVRVPATAVRMSLAIHAATVMAANSYDLYMRAGSSIHFTRTGHTLTVDGYDVLTTGNPDGMTLAGWSTPPLVPGTDYYFTFVHRNPSDVLLGFIATVTLGPPPVDAGDAGGEDAAEVVEDVPAETTDVAADTAEVAADTAPDVVPDAAPDTAADGGADAAADGAGTVTLSNGGCGCRAAASPTGGALFVALLFGAVLLRRRGR